MSNVESQTALRPSGWKSHVPRFMRFLAVGILNSAFGYTLFAIIYLASGNYRLGIVLATTLGVVFNFFSTGRLVFKSRQIRSFVPFVSGYIVICVLNIAALDGLVTLGAGPLLGQILLMPLLAVLSYAINWRFVFQAQVQR